MKNTNTYGELFWKNEEITNDFYYTSEKSIAAHSLEERMKNGEKFFKYEDVKEFMDRDRYNALIERDGKIDNKEPSFFEVVKNEVDHFLEKQEYFTDKQIETCKNLLNKDELPKWNDCSLILTYDNSLTQVGFQTKPENLTIDFTELRKDLIKSNIEKIEGDQVEKMEEKFGVQNEQDNTFENMHNGQER